MVRAERLAGFMRLIRHSPNNLTLEKTGPICEGGRLPLRGVQATPRNSTP